MKLNWSRRELEFLGEPINPELPTKMNRTAGGGGKGSAPPPPDYAGAAEKQAQSSMEVTKYQTQANRPNIVTPWGQQTWTGDEDNNWTQTTTLTPDAEAALNSQLNMQRGRSDIANDLMPKARDAVTQQINYDAMSPLGSTPTQSQFQGMGNAPQLQTNLDTSGVPQMPGQFNAQGIPGMPTYDSNFVQGVQDQALNFMRPDMEQQQAALDSKLANQGIAYGSKAWETAQRRMADQQARDKYQALNTAMSQGNQMYSNQLAANQQGFNQADRSFSNNLGLNNQGFNQATQAFSLGNAALQNQNSMDLGNRTFNNQNMQNTFTQQQQNAEYQNRLRQQQIAESQMRQLQPLNNINALLTGQQVGMPSMPAFNTAQTSQPVQYLNAANSLGNYNMAAAQMNNASSNSMLGGAFGLAGQAAGGYLSNPMAFSDRRLKVGIKKIGKLGRFNLYRYRYVGSSVEQVGVMADEVKKLMPQAVKRHANGFDMVDYSMIGA
jgi:hypothetical protein